ncbi:stress response translation initiation inhibitor YciH [Psychromonas antarctica]|jgi:translation initiation factor 1|uniref:stress response translation initiation inhibitor YciH n=1 Tax=Psychromonas antarctica TaxID=67573 RepID=UPI001EE9ABC0|nr:stress response translation initiation inhibitor YciH [Psychromonas antarctica]MCG6200906.1 stress response translation initiation inhibitor YciH [Psychromonas antarctica]
MDFNDLNLVYSTDRGKIDKPSAKIKAPEVDGIVRIHRETKGRKGKGVTLIKGLAIDAEALKTLAKEIKKRTGTGGCVKDFVIEIQGDQREIVKSLLEIKGYKVKLAGG